MSIEIRAAEPSDVPTIRAVATDPGQEAHAPVIGADRVEEFLRRYYDPESFERRIDRDDEIFDVAVDAHDVVGYVLASPTDDSGSDFDRGQLSVAPPDGREEDGSY